METRDRFHQLARVWNVAIEQIIETDAAFVGFGRRSTDAVVLKVSKRKGDEWTSGEVLRAFQGHGVVKVHEVTGGAVLLDRMLPGHPLTALTLDGRDDDATDIAAEVIAQMSDCPALPACPTVQDWGRGFERYVATSGREIPPDLVDEGHRWFSALSASQQQRPGRLRLLHGDLHHDNILFDARHGWLAIDPKGVIGETEYEIGAWLRNPMERPDLFVSTSIIERRVTRLSTRLAIDGDRTIAWAFSQAVLSAIWSVEDGERVDAQHPVLRLAEAIRPLLRGSI